MNTGDIFQPEPFAVRLNTKPTYWHCEPGWEWRARPLPDSLLWYVMDGAGQMRLDGQVWELSAGTCFVFPPKARPYGTQDPDRRLVVFGMHFDLLDAHGEAPLQPAAMPPLLGQMVRDTAFFATLAQQCDAGYRRGDPLGAWQSRVYLQAMLLHLWEEALHPRASAAELAIDDIVRAIHREPGKRWSVADLARWAHLSRAQFVRRFRAATGLSPAHFMIQVRLERARQLIQETTMPLGQIATALGYEDVYFFSRQYKHYCGSPPSALRRE